MDDMTAATVAPTSPPPISGAYDQLDGYSWRNRNSGDLVTWNAERRCYERWNPQNAAWYRWGPTRDGALGWHLYSARFQKVDFYALTIIGLIFMVLCIVSGYWGVGILIWGFMSICGLGFSWLHTYHPNGYSIITVLGGLWAIGSMMGHRRRHIPW